VGDEEVVVDHCSAVHNSGHKARLTKAVAAVKADCDVALAQFNKGEGGFREGDLYPIAQGSVMPKPLPPLLYVPVGTDIRTLKAPTAKSMAKSS
jgi:hypothetical protein